MSNDRLARSDIVTGALDETDYDAVYAAVTATERGRWFLTEYANRNRHAETASLVAAMARIEAVLAANHGMAADKGVPANNVSSLDLAAAAERFLDIAFALRERAVDPALCDVLDAAVREICQANSDHVEASEQPSPAHPPSVGTPLPLRPSDDPDDLFEHSPSNAVAPIAEATAAPQPQTANGIPAQATSRPPSCDPLADIRGLSEEELLALFG